MRNDLSWLQTCSLPLWECFGSIDPVHVQLATGPHSVEPTQPSFLWTEACSLESFHFRNGREWNKKLFNQMWYMCACQVVISIFYDKSRQDKTKHFFNFRATSDVSEHRLGKSRIRISNQSSLPSSKCVVSDFCLFSEFLLPTMNHRNPIMSCCVLGKQIQRIGPPTVKPSNLILAFLATPPPLMSAWFFIYPEHMRSFGDKHPIFSGEWSYSTLTFRVATILIIVSSALVSVRWRWSWW